MAERIMGLDVGDKWIGVAVSDETGLIANALKPVRRQNLPSDLEQIAQLADVWNVGQIVVGLPLNMNATVGPQAQKTLNFVDRLKRMVPVPVSTWDERLTTQQAERILIQQEVRRENRKAVIDGVAASLILQAYLDHARMVRTREETHMADDKDFEAGFSEEEDEIITLTDDEGKEHEFVVVDVIEVNQKEYAILLPIDTEEDEEAEAVILRLEKDADGDDVLVDIESEEEWEQVAQAYEELLDDEGEE
ncbi:Holliday junction resolvase RuvX [Sulfobacillus sp. DSM 109850]|uniref:Multifunctional fusion protein n=2 Tax=Sulfobacillus harzensis TaxID=2729629 RepID=A0A7Y0L4F1_9FIRM|nr:Holliday junction resolvase RuvX [Sulfobacillus harzensis]NMP22481.1 Holliday junction resolvase RuvX [Sulfobacillus harzensis]